MAALLSSNRSHGTGWVARPGRRSAMGTQGGPVVQARAAAPQQQSLADLAQRDHAGGGAPALGRGLPAPLQAGVEALSGLAMDDVQVHRASSLPARFGALATTQGNQIHLAPGQDQHLAHEAWHVVQQKQGRVTPTPAIRPGGVPFNADPALEAEADAMGQRAARAAPVTGPGAAVLQQVAAPAQAVVQHFDDGKGKGARWRVADDRQMAVSQESGIYGGRRFFADSTLISSADSVLKSQKSALSLAAGGETLTVPSPDGGAVFTLTRVEPTNRNDGSTGNDRASGMKWPEDCGLAANTVMQGGGRNTRAVYANPKPAVEPGFFAKILNALSGRFAAEKLSPKVTYGTVYAVYRGRNFYSPHKMLDDVFADAMELGPTAAWDAYQKLNAVDKEKFDQQVGINKYASPEVGEAFSIVANKDENIDMGTWNFHWGGVVMKSGGDVVTMENFAGSGATAWDFQMYGPPSKAGQTFHEQQKERKKHDGVTPEYGDNPTTLRVRAVP